MAGNEIAKIIVASLTQDPTSQQVGLVVIDVNTDRLYCRDSWKWDLNTSDKIYVGEDGSLTLPVKNLQELAQAIVQSALETRFNGLECSHIFIDRSVNDFLIGKIRDYVASEGTNLNIVKVNVINSKKDKIEEWLSIDEKLMTNFIVRNLYNIRLVSARNDQKVAIEPHFIKFKKNRTLHFMVKAWFIAIYMERAKFLQNAEFVL